MAQQITEEELRNMSPEQIAELQKQNCIFCHIVAGRASAKKIYEDDRCIAILDINPANPGHVLLLPREHYAVMPQIPEDIIGHLFMVAKGISHACLRSFRAEGTNIFVANGVAAGQRAQHFMVHIIPRKENDGLDMFKLPHTQAGKEQIAQLFRVIKPFVSKALGVKGQEPIVIKGRAEERGKTGNAGNKERTDAFGETEKHVPGRTAGEQESGLKELVQKESGRDNAESLRNSVSKLISSKPIFSKPTPKLPDEQDIESDEEFKAVRLKLEETLRKEESAKKAADKKGLSGRKGRSDDAHDDADDAGQGSEDGENKDEESKDREGEDGHGEGGQDDAGDSDDGQDNDSGGKIDLDKIASMFGGSR